MEPVKSKRGGARPGAGRKPGILAPEQATILAAAVAAQAAAPSPKPVEADMSPEDVVALARYFSGPAVRTLAIIAAKGVKEASRVAAARAIIETARLIDPQLAPAVVLGKKQMAAEAALTAGQESGWGDDLKTPMLYRN